MISLAGIALRQASCLPPGSVHVAVSGTAMHWVADAAALASTGSVFPGYPDHEREAERRAWRVAAARQWERLLEMRALELAPGGRLVAAVPASPRPRPRADGALRRDHRSMNRILSGWCRAGRVGAATVAAIVVPVWMRTLEEIRAPFEARGGLFAGLELESAELFRLDNPCWNHDPAEFAREYVRSVTARGSRSSFVLSPSKPRTALGICSLPPGRPRGARRGSSEPLPPRLHRGSSSAGSRAVHPLRRSQISNSTTPWHADDARLVELIISVPR